MTSINYKVIVIDTETTGTDPYSDELLQIAIINGSGRVLFNKYLKPTHTNSWPDAQKVNHISPKKVSRCKTVDKYKRKIQKIIDDADIIVGYNIKKFDIPFLESAGLSIGSKQIIDVFLDVKGKFAKWPKLADVALCTGYIFTPHDALEDCKATLHIFNRCYIAEVKKRSREEGSSHEVQKEIVKEANKANRFGKVVDLIKKIILLVVGIFLFLIICDFGQNNLPIYFGEKRGLFIGMLYAGLFCYVFDGIIGPIVGTVGSAMYFLVFEESTTAALLSLQILITLIALRFCFWFTKRHKNIIIRFLLCSMAIFACMLIVYYLLGTYLLSTHTAISLEEWKNNTIEVAKWNAIFMELGLPFYMLFSKVFERLL